MESLSLMKVIPEFVILTASYNNEPTAKGILHQLLIKIIKTLPSYMLMTALQTKQLRLDACGNKPGNFVTLFIPKRRFVSNIYSTIITIS